MCFRVFFLSQNVHLSFLFVVKINNYSPYFCDMFSPQYIISNNDLSSPFRSAADNIVGFTGTIEAILVLLVFKWGIMFRGPSSESGKKLANVTRNSN